MCTQLTCTATPSWRACRPNGQEATPSLVHTNQPRLIITYTNASYHTWQILCSVALGMWFSTRRWLSTPVTVSSNVTCLTFNVNCIGYGCASRCANRNRHRSHFSGLFRRRREIFFFRVFSRMYSSVRASHAGYVSRKIDEPD